MSLYLLPPSGVIPFHKLQEYALKRLKFLLRLSACQNPNEVHDTLQDAEIVCQSDCLITGTLKDSISHHILRLILGGDAETMSFITESEVALFKLRIDAMDEREWNLFFKSLEKDLRKTDENLAMMHCKAIFDLKHLTEILKTKFVCWQQLSSEICQRQTATSATVFCVPFQMVFTLVSSRQVDINKGMALVPVSLIREVLIERFQMLMAAAVKQAALEREQSMKDERMVKLATSLMQAYRCEKKPSSQLPGNLPPLRLADLWTHSRMFPPCMANLVKELREQHRLNHHDRIQLTLFLKEIGLPVHDALLLWKREYSLPGPMEKPGCRHGWKGNEGRYIYNIRHLYGLEGSRINYRAHGCLSIQNRSLKCGDAGGCPFVSQDRVSLTKFLTDHGVESSSIPHILQQTNDRLYGNACKSYMIDKLKTNEKECFPMSLYNLHDIDGKQCDRQRDTAISDTETCVRKLCNRKYMYLYTSPHRSKYHEDLDMDSVSDTETCVTKLCKRKYPHTSTPPHTCTSKHCVDLDMDSEAETKTVCHHTEKVCSKLCEETCVSEDIVGHWKLGKRDAKLVQQMSISGLAPKHKMIHGDQEPSCKCFKGKCGKSIQSLNAEDEELWTSLKGQEKNNDPCETHGPERPLQQTWKLPEDGATCVRKKNYDVSSSVQNYENGSVCFSENGASGKQMKANSIENISFSYSHKDSNASDHCKHCEHCEHFSGQLDLDFMEILKQDTQTVCHGNDYSVDETGTGHPYQISYESHCCQRSTCAASHVEIKNDKYNSTSQSDNIANVGAVLHGIELDNNFIVKKPRDYYWSYRQFLELTKHNTVADIV